jgi:putative transposase
VKRFQELGGKGKVRVMFQDEAGFGRISKPKACWISGQMRPSVPCHHIREYRYVYGAVDPIDGENYFILAPYCNSDWMNVFFDELSKAYPDDCIILIMDNATWHKSKSLRIPEQITCLNIPPYTPEMNPIEQIWKELRKSFANKLFATLDKVLDNLCEAIQNLSNETVKSITGRKWILDIFQS